MCCDSCGNNILALTQLILAKYVLPSFRRIVAYEETTFEDIHIPDQHILALLSAEEAEATIVGLEQIRAQRAARGEARAEKMS